MTSLCSWVGTPIVRLALLRFFAALYQEADMVCLEAFGGLGEGCFVDCLFDGGGAAGYIKGDRRLHPSCPCCRVCLLVPCNAYMARNLVAYYRCSVSIKASEVLLHAEDKLVVVVGVSLLHCSEC